MLKNLKWSFLDCLALIFFFFLEILSLSPEESPLIFCHFATEWISKNLYPLHIFRRFESVQNCHFLSDNRFSQYISTNIFFNIIRIILSF